MSETNNTFRCPVCDRTNQATAFFCFACGTKLSIGSQEAYVQTTEEIVLNEETIEFDDIKFEELMETTDFEMATPFENTTTVVSKNATSSASDFLDDMTFSSPKRNRYSLGHCKKSAIFLFCLSLFLCLTFFMPFVKVSTAYNDTSAYEIAFSPADFVSFTLSAIHHNSHEFLIATEEYRLHTELEKQIEELNFNKHLIGTQEDLLKEYTISAIRINLMDENTSPKVSLILATVLTVFAFGELLYIFILLLCCFFSENSSKNSKIFYERAKKKLILLFAAVPLYLFVLLRACRFSISSNFVYFGNGGASLAGGGILLLLTLIALTAYIGYKNIALIFKKGFLRIDYVQLRSIIAFVCLLLSVLSIFLPFATIKLATPTQTDTVKEKVSLFSMNFYELSNTEYDYIFFVKNSVSEEDFLALVDNVINGKESAINFGTLASNFILDVSSNPQGHLALFSLLFFSMFALALLHLAFEKQPIKHPGRLMFGAIICSIAYLDLSIIFVSQGNMNTSYVVAQHVLFSVGIGPILSVISTIAAVALLLFREKKKVLCEFDDPDVSCNPYVL